MQSQPAAADRLVAMIELIIQDRSPVRIRAWDGSTAGPSDAPTLIVRSRRALRRLLGSFGELGIARAYIAGEVDVEGDLVEVLGRLADAGRAIGRSPRPRRSAIAPLLKELVVLQAVGPVPQIPLEEIQLGGVRHSQERDRQAVTAHYDVGNDFYRHFLGPSMVYSCAYWRAADDPAGDLGYDLAAAQRDKLDLVCRKLDLKPGMRVLDIGGGWGSFAIHAARHYGVEVVVITLSGEQVTWGQARVAEAGLENLIDIRLMDWRDLDESTFDAIASIGMAEHVGGERFADYAAALYARLRPGGRLLNHQIAKTPSSGPPTPSPPRRLIGQRHRTFIDSYVFPDGELLPLGTVVEKLEEVGFEVRDVQNLREHYALTLRRWVRNLEDHWDECVALTSQGRVRVWRLYLAASAIGFDLGLLRINQTLAVRAHPDGHSDFPLVREL